MKEKYLSLKLRYKAVEGQDESGVSEEGEFIAYGNIPGVIDYNNEAVDSLEAYQPTIDFHEQEGSTIKMLYQHNADKVIGVWDSWGIDQTGFWLKGRLNRKIQLGEEVYQNLKMGALDSMSIGYMVLEEYEDSDGVIHLKSLIINECSVVTFPANAASKVISIKAKLDKEKQDDEQEQDEEVIQEPAIEKVSIKSWSAYKNRNSYADIIKTLKS